MKFKHANSEDLVTDLTTVENLYGDQNLAATSLFAGGFINFGYWKYLKINPQISLTTRALSSKRLYDKIFEYLSINITDSLLEVGCGLGNGCILAHQKHKPKYVIGIDASFPQIQRATERHKNYLKKTRDSLIFMVDSAENFKLPPNSISKVFSVEALQHFQSTRDFLNTVFKTLKSEGQLVVTTFFLKSAPPPNFLDLFPNFANGVDKLIKLNEFKKELIENGFIDIQSESIGSHVWQGFDKWISQTEYRDTWDKNWLEAYKAGILDYYIFTAKKPKTL